MAQENAVAVRSLRQRRLILPDNQRIQSGQMPQYVFYGPFVHVYQHVAAVGIDFDEYTGGQGLRDEEAEQIRHILEMGCCG